MATTEVLSELFVNIREYKGTPSHKLATGFLFPKIQMAKLVTCSKPDETDEKTDGEVVTVPAMTPPHMERPRVRPRAPPTEFTMAARSDTR